MKKYIPLLLLLGAAFFLLSSCKTGGNAGMSDRFQKGITINNPDTLDAILNRYVNDGLYPCLYARIENFDGKVLYEHSAVNKNLIPDIKIDGNTWFRIWSMSKIVTISVALDLVEDGIIKLNDPVTKYIPEFKNLQVAVAEDGKPLSDFEWSNTNGACPFKLVPMDSVMTVLHLINHQAGFYYAATSIPCLDSLAGRQNLPASKNTDEYIKRLTRLPLLQQPGHTHFYGTNTTVLGFVAERATGKSLKQLVEARVTGPLNIQGLQYALPPDVRLLPRFSGKDTLIREAYPGELNIFGSEVVDYDPAHQLYQGGEGMLATADGYTDFLRMLLNRGTLNGHRFLEVATVEDIHAPHTQLDNPYGHNGYNLWISGDTMRISGAGEAGLWIGGGYEGTHFWVDPKRKFVAVLMTQMSLAQPAAYKKDDEFRGAIYRQFWKDEK